MFNNVPASEARRYLSILAIVNDKHKSDLSQLDEMSVEKEYSLQFGSPGRRPRSPENVNALLNQRRVGMQAQLGYGSGPDLSNSSPGIQPQYNNPNN